MKITRVRSGPRRHLFVCPRAMRHRLRQQSLIAKVILKDLFQLIHFFQAVSFHRKFKVWRAHLAVAIVAGETPVPVAS